MSLEQALNENTAAIKLLISVMQSVSVPGPVAAATTTEPAAKRTRKAADKAADTTSAATADTTSAAAADTGTGTPGNVAANGVEYVAPGTNDGATPRYFHVAAHKTVAAIQPGELIPNIAGMLEISAEQYATLKAQYSPPVQPVVASTPAAAPAATPSATTASSPSPAVSPDVDGPKLMELCKALHARDGNDGLRKVLEKFKVTKVGEIVANTAIHAEAAAFVNGLLNPVAAATTETPAVENLFG